MKARSTRKSWKNYKAPFQHDLLDPGTIDKPFQYSQDSQLNLGAAIDALSQISRSSHQSNASRALVSSQVLDAPTTATSAISAPCVSAPAPSIVHCDASNRLNPNLSTFLQPAEPAAAVGKSMNSHPQSLLGEACTDSVQTFLPSNAGDPNSCNASVFPLMWVAVCLALSLP